MVGLGLIGGSIARGIKRSDDSLRVGAVDTDEQQLCKALSDGSINEFGELDVLCPQADLIVIALPPLATAEILPRIAELCSPQAVVTDVASVKSSVIAAVNELEADFIARFVPGHPIAGSEKSGYGASSENLFDQRNIIVTPQADTAAEAIGLVHEMWRVLGADILGMSVKRHDEVLAATSHLPHLLAFAIVNALLKQEQSEDIFRYAAGGFADFSRLASSDAQMWADIFVSNADPAASVLDDYIDSLMALREALKKQDHTTLFNSFSQARNVRNNFMAKYFKPMNQEETEQDKAISFAVEPGGQVQGDIRVPGDKSISHRAIIIGAIANGVTRVHGFLEGDDALNTLAAFREMGVTIVGPESGELIIYGVGKNGLKAPRKPLYMGNSGTAMRLMCGLLAAQPFDSELIGDESLSTRPMNRIAEPLREMGAVIETTAEGTPPLCIHGQSLNGIEYKMPIASAQVKSCLLLAGLYGQGETRVHEPGPCRDHTERMLAGFAYPISSGIQEGLTVLEGGHELTATDIEIPADISSSAFFLVAAAITPGAHLLLRHVGTNPTRIGIVNLLRLMGADIQFSNESNIGTEPVVDITVKYAPLHGIEIPAEQIPLAIDEFPVLFIAAACASGDTVLHGAEELRVKESDRIDAMATGLATLGIETETFADGIRITGGSIGGGEVDSRADHRIAMAFTVAALRAESPILIKNCANVATSFPGFVELASSVGIQLQVAK
ncbi:MAG: bifunctional prephenate dehydrogenase/3-phosphoshikimate 1-carboxyvinyltransferase [Gammaproteobacteria bacterium]|nr:bifunctional prephenate dehydrogenase/3-phosphoshikimate 1-carboxyvinyltransferase [Gammaproteobacteria bacterium]